MKTTPLTKAVATLEGWLLAAATVVPWVVSLVDPGILPPKIAAEWSAISAVALGASRTIIKGVAVAKGATGITPNQIDVEGLARNLVAHAGVMVPSTKELQAIVSEAVRVAADPKDVIEQFLGVTSAATQDVAGAPLSTVTAADGNNAVVSSVAQSAPPVVAS